jgi:PAS domain S-box-containing protein
MEKEGFEVLTVHDGFKGIDVFKSYAPNIVILDIMLPGIDGWQVCRELRKISDIPVIMLTAKSETFDKVLGLELGADDYIVKPFEYDELLTSIETRLRKAEHSRKSNEEKFLALSMISPYGIYIYQGETFIETNPSLLDMLGYSRKELLNMSFEDIIAEQDRAVALPRINRCLRGLDKEIHLRFNAIHKDKSLVASELYGIEGIRVKGKTSLLGILTPSKPELVESEELDHINLNEIEEFEKAVDMIAGNRNYISTELINRLISVFRNNELHREKTDDVISFSERELEVLGEVCKGLSTKEIADKLFISSRTVEKHRANLMTKVEAKNIIEVIIYAVKHKLIDL